jgi:hypothetical protein
LLGQVSITPKEPDLLAEAGEPGWRRPYVYNIEYKDSLGVVFDLAGNSFVEVCFMLEGELWAAFQATPEIFQVQIYDESQSPPQWRASDQSVYPYRQQVCGITSQFSLISLAYQEPATPTPEPGSIQKMTETPVGTGTPGVYEP